MANQPLTTYKGGFLSFTVTYKDCNGAIIPLDNYTFHMQIRASLESQTVLADLTMDSGLTVPDPALGQLVVFLSSTKTGFMPKETVFDIKPIDGNGETDPQMVVFGKILWFPLVTRA